MGWVVSVKGVLLHEDRVLLALNDRQEWELPGGQLEPGEQPADTVVREFAEETGLTIRAGSMIDSWVFEVVPGKSVVIIALACALVGPAEMITVSAEHQAVTWHPVSRLEELDLPEGYRRAVAACRSLPWRPRS